MLEPVSGVSPIKTTIKPSGKCRILVIDSGVGGLSVYEHIRKKLGGCDFFYCADNGFYPYGTKTEDSLNKRLLLLVSSLISPLDPDIIVLACNTASTTTLQHIRNTIDKPVVGVVPAIKPAANLTGSGHIALLATSTTINSHYTETLIKDFAHNLKVYKIACDSLVQVAEEKLAGKSPSISCLKEIITPDYQNNTAYQSLEMIDTAVLACTHFPLLLAELQLALPAVRHWVDSGDAIARRVFDLLQKSALLQKGEEEAGNAIFLHTQETDYYKKIESTLSERFGFSSTLLHEMDR